MYRFKVWQHQDQTQEIEIELECLSEPEAYTLALLFLQTVGYAIFRAQLVDWEGHHVMYYRPKNGWSFGDDRDRVFA